MEFLSKIAEYTIEPVGRLLGRQVGYVIHCRTNIQRMGVCGIGGVGKTTLVKEVYKQVSEDKLFDNVVILLDVKKEPNLEAIQKKIVEQLSMDILPDETIVGRGSRLCAKIQSKNVVVILDDVQEKIDLEVMGLPRLPTCKVLLTCRTRDVLSFDKMRADVVFPLDLLGKEETWSLFVKTAGDVIKHKGRIQDIAIQVAGKCGGLPLLVVTVASALKERKKLPAWKVALKQLKGFDKEDSTEKAYLALEWSYNQLDDKELKPLFLLCGIIVKQNHIYMQDLLKYGMGLALFRNVDTVEEARDALDSLVERLKDSCLLMDSDVDGKVRMHDLVCHVANRIAYRDQHVLSVEYGGELVEWPSKDFFKKCSKIFLPHNKIPTLSEVPLECPELEFFHIHNKDLSMKIPSNFFSEMQELKVLDLTMMHMRSLPSSLQCLKKLKTLCLDACTLGDIALLGQLSSLEILSFLQSNVRELPKEIGQLTRLRLLDLCDCTQLVVISPTVISSLVRLEDLRMRNSFNKWAVEGEGSNASLSELKHLSQLSALEIHIPNVDVLPPNLFSHKLERFNISIGDVWVQKDFWRKLMDKTTLNTLELKLTNNIEELDEALKLLLKRTEDLSLDETESVINIVQQLDTEYFENLKHLRLRNSIAFTDIINRKVLFPNLITLIVHGCDNLRLLLSVSMARSLVQLTHLKISACELMQEIISSTRECGEENMDIILSKLKVLKLHKLPNLVRFCTGNHIEFPTLEKLKIEDCDKLLEFISDEVAMSSEDSSVCKEIGQGVLEVEENLDVKSKTIVQYFLFDKKVGFPSLERLSIKGTRELKAIWHVQLARDSFRRLKQVDVQECNDLISLFPPSVMGRLNALEILKIWSCGSLEVIFELSGRSNVKEIHVDTSFPHDQLKHFDCQNLDSISIFKCHCLKQIFPASVARGLQNLTRLSVDNCDAIEEIVGEEDEKEGPETTPPYFVFPKVTSVELKNLPQLTSFYPKTHASQWPLLAQLEVMRCDKVKIFASEFSLSQKKHEMNNLMSQPPFFSINEGSLVNLEDLELTCNEIWNGPPPANRLLFGKLKSITFRGSCAPFSKQASVLFLQRLQNLEKIGMANCSLEAIFDNHGISAGEEIHDDAVWSGALPRVRILRLESMDELMHLENDNSQSLLFPNLEILEVWFCERLKSLESYAIFFRNLTTLTIFSCDGLEYLTSYSVATSLVQLTTLKVGWCYRIAAIVSINGDDDANAAGNEITFNRLQHLELTGLPGLQGFCSGNCRVKFPSSITLEVYSCPTKLKISPDGVLLTEIDDQFEQKGDDGEQKNHVETVQRTPVILSEEPAI